MSFPFQIFRQNLWSGNLPPSMKTPQLQRTRVKICGITTTEAAQWVVDAGADAIGLVFYPPSPRDVSIIDASRITKALPPFVQSVGLFVNAERALVEQVLADVPLSMLQFHGDEDEAYCNSFGRPYMKAIRVKAESDLQAIAEKYQSASGLLLDSYQQGNPGGTGHTFNWSQIPESLPLPVVLAGGLNAENVGDAIRTVHPYAVDVSSGVEIEKGVKSPEKIVAFMRGVKESNE